MRRIAFALILAFAFLVLLARVERSSVQAVDQPDLVPTALSAPPTGDAGRPITFSFSVANQETAQATAPWTDGLFLSADDHFGGAADFLMNPIFTQSGNLAAGASYTVPSTGTTTATLPQVPAGDYFLLLQTDRVGQVYEGGAGPNENDNVLAIPFTVGNRPPTANAGGPYSVGEGSSTMPRHLAGTPCDAPPSALPCPAMDEIVMLWRRNRIRSGAQLRSLRMAAGLTQLELSARSGITHEAISRLELGTRSPRSVTIQRLATALDVDPADLVGKPKPADA